jgi:hypothetical protein
MQESRRWEMSNWARLCDLIWEELNGVAILFGARPDVELCDDIEATVKHPLINTVGKTSISELAALLERCKMLITNDTGTMHLATAVGIPIVAIFLAAARADDTAPYGRGHVILEANVSCAPCDYHRSCPNPVCHGMIAPEVVLEAIRHHPLSFHPYYCKGGHKGGLDDGSQNIIPSFPDEGKWKSVRISIADFDPWGQLIMRPCIPRPLSRKQVLSLAYRYLWRQELSRRNDNSSAQYLSLMTSVLELTKAPEAPISFENDLEDLEKLQELAAMGLERAAIMSNLAAKPDIGVLKKLTAHFAVIDRDIYNWELTHSDLAPLAIHFRIDKGNIEHDDIQFLADKAKSLYGDLKRRAERFQQILQTTEQFLKVERGIPLSNKNYELAIMDRKSKPDNAFSRFVIRNS